MNIKNIIIDNVNFEKHTHWKQLFDSNNHILEYLNEDTKKTVELILENLEGHQLKDKKIIDIFDLFFKEKKNIISESLFLLNALSIHLNNKLTLKTKESKGLKKEIKIDALTGILSKKAIYDKIRKEAYNITKNPNHNSIIAFLDIDYFKKINDTYGHSVGDITLKEIGKLFKKDTRKTDSIGRWGGEEFLILMSKISLKNGKYKLNNLRKSIQEILHKNIQKYTKQNITPITISIGLSPIESKTLKKDISNINDYIQIADNALYAAKNNGRNKVVEVGSDIYNNYMSKNKKED